MLCFEGLGPKLRFACLVYLAVVVDSVMLRCASMDDGQSRCYGYCTYHAAYSLLQHRGALPVVELVRHRQV